MKNWEILCFYDDEIIAEHEYETLEKAREIFQKVISYVHNNIDTEDGHHRTMLLIEKYVDNNVKESLIKEIILFQGDWKVDNE